MTNEANELQSAMPDRQERLDQLSGYFTDIATGETLQPETMQYVQTGGSVRLCLQEIQALVEKSEEEKQLDLDRVSYVDTLLERPLVRGRPAYRQAVEGLRGSYVDAVVAKTERIVDAQTPEDSLALLQMPTLIRNTSFAADRNLTMEDLSSNHLYVLIDTALQEHVARRNLIDAHHRKALVTRFFGNRVVRMALAGGVFAATVTPELHIIPVDSQTIAEEIDATLQVISATVFGLEVPEEIRWRYLDFTHNKHKRALHEQLAESRQLSDLALRAAYSSTRYGSASENGAVTDRFGTDDKDENLRRFAKLDEQFKHLNNDPGGKPYSGDQALDYAARLLIEKKDRLAHILALHGDPAAQKEHYLQLVRDILVEDITRMEKGLTSSRIRQRMVRAASIIPAVLFPQALSLANDASSGGQDALDAVTFRPEESSEDE
jgi:hypothetical protein